MKTIEINSRTDQLGHLKIDYPVNKSNKKVRVLIFLDDDVSDYEEELWMKSISNNPAFEYLNNSSEDVYTLNDGEPLDD